ncbi:MAG: hypothetical protein QW726_05435 [Fervidicoccaceae archaeon]
MSESGSQEKRSAAESFHEYTIRVLEFINRAASNALAAAKSGNYESCDFALAQVIAAAMDLRSKINAAREKGVIRFAEF